MFARLRPIRKPGKPSPPRRKFRCGLVAWALAGMGTIGFAARGAEADASLRRKPAFLGEAGEHQRGEAVFFPIGIYHVRHTEGEYARLAAHGFNTIQGMFPGDPGRFRQSLDLALRHGLAVDVPLYAQGGVAANLPASLRLLKREGRHPAVLCWKILDEPDAKRNAAVRGEVPRVYAALRALGLPQPLELTLSHPDGFGDWTPFCDAVQVDCYPLPGGSVAEVYDACLRARKAMQPWQSLTAVLQCGWTRDLTTQPSVTQARAMVYLALIGGARGIAWYSKREEDGWDLERTPLWPHLAGINREIRALSGPLLRGEEATVRCDDPVLPLRGCLYEGRLYILLCNPRAEPVRAALRLPPGRWETPRAMDTPSRQWPLEGGVVRVRLAPLESRTVVVEAKETKEAAP